MKEWRKWGVGSGEWEFMFGDESFGVGDCHASSGLGIRG